MSRRTVIKEFGDCPEEQPDLKRLPAWHPRHAASVAEGGVRNQPSPDGSDPSRRIARRDTAGVLSAWSHRARFRFAHKSHTRAAQRHRPRASSSRVGPQFVSVAARFLPPTTGTTPSSDARTLGDLLCSGPPELSTMLPRGRSSVGVRPAPPATSGTTGPVARTIGGACGYALDLRQRDRTRPAQSRAEHNRAVSSGTRAVTLGLVGGCWRIGPTQTSSGDALVVVVLDFQRPHCRTCRGPGACLSRPEGRSSWPSRRILREVRCRDAHDSDNGRQRRRDP